MKESIPRIEAASTSGTLTGAITAAPPPAASLNCPRPPNCPRNGREAAASTARWALSVTSSLVRRRRTSCVSGMSHMAISTDVAPLSLRCTVTAGGAVVVERAVPTASDSAPSLRVGEIARLRLPPRAGASRPDMEWLWK